MQHIENKWDEIIKPKTSWFDLRLNEILKYRDLVMLFVKRDFVSVYKQTILGPLWHIIQPLLTTIIFTVIFTGIARISTDGTPPVLFYMLGIVCWNYFSTCLTKTSATFIANASIFGKVYFPRLTVPVSVVISNLISFAIQFGIFIVFLLYYYFKGFEINISVAILILPLLVIMMAMLGLGLGIIISSLTTKYRDLQFLVNFGVQLLMYATPVIYPLSAIPEKFKFLVIYNPMTPIIECFKYALLGKGSFSFSGLLIGFITTFFIFIVGIVLFNKVEKNFMDTI